MCGISAIISKNSFSKGPLEKMTDAIIHRGPDGYGYYYGPGIALGHRRLAIIDLSDAGHQPMEYLERYVITYNGEIYNYLEIRQKLERDGYTFKSRTDTEVILAAFDKWNTDCVYQFNGMWALVIYDKKENVIFCSRDRYGVKPFYYWAAPDQTVYFGSEIKQFIDLPGWKAQINPQRVYDYLAFGLTHHTDETLFKNVFELKKGHSMHLTLNNIKVEETGRLPASQWYELNPLTFSGSFEEARVEFKNLFIDSVKLRLRADVPVGSCLSGGLDSSAIVCVMNNLLLEKKSSSLQQTFSAYNEVEQYNERKWVDIVVNATNVESYYEYPSLNDLFDSLESITWHHDEPFNGTGIYLQWCVFRLAASNNVKVILDGQGGDELLAGYSSFFPPRLAGLLKSGQLFNFWKEINAIKKLHGFSMTASSIRVANMLLPNFIRRSFLNLLNTHDPAPKWLNMEILMASPSNPYLSLDGSTKNIQAMSKLQLNSTHLPTLLHWEDRDSMAHSIESRCPFLDYRLVEFALGLPDEFKLSNGLTKRVLRDGMSGILPDPIRDRINKLGFMAPEEMWMKNRNPDIFREKLNQAIDAGNGIFNSCAYDVLENTISGKIPFTSLPWRIINFGTWMKLFNVSTH